MMMVVGLLVVLLAGGISASAEDVFALDGTWRFRLDPGNEGVDRDWANAAYEEVVRLPGSLDENRKGTPVDVAQRSWLSRSYQYVGAAWYQRDITVPESWAGRRLELFLERCHWESRLWVDGRPVGMRDSLCTPHVYRLEPLTPGPHTITLRVDNSVKYPVGLRAHSITEHTQTNWNGVVGRMTLRALPSLGFNGLVVYPDAAKRLVRAVATVENRAAVAIEGRVAMSALGVQKTEPITVETGKVLHVELTLPLPADAPLWSEFDPRLIDLDARVETMRDVCDATRVRFGLRSLGREGTQLLMNGNPYFVRGTLECCIFPFTGYPSMDQKTWRRMMETARQYGLNHMRFHSWCPPEAAFAAADETGMTLQVETPVWTDLGKFPDLDQFIREEADAILAVYGNHPSFAMLAVGNEPSGPDKDTFLTAIVSDWQAKDPRRLYTTCAGWPELPVSDFHIVHARHGKAYRLHGGPLGPTTMFDYRDVLEGCSAPAISHELGQWCVYPDYSEIPRYTGVLRARNLEMFRESLQRNGMRDQARAFTEASGKLQRLMYKADIEAMLRTPGAAGFQLLALHDFPGQGGALEGFLDAFWNSKGVVTPDEFREFCGDVVPLLRLPKFVWTVGETLHADAEIANFGAGVIASARPQWEVRNAYGDQVAGGEWETRDLPLGNGITLGAIAMLLTGDHVGKLTLRVHLAGTPWRNAWDVWVYPQYTAETPPPVLIAEGWNESVRLTLEQGRDVLLLPKVIAPMRRVKGAFEPIFWNTQWFPGQDRQLGVLCQPDHPALAAFPNDGHTDWQWWELLDKSVSVRVDGLDPHFRPIVQIIDDWNKNRLLGAVFEGRTGKGRLLVCTLDITHDLQNRPAASALRRSLLSYMASDRFSPRFEIPPPWLDEVFSPASGVVAQVEADSAAGGFAPENAADGNPDTMWHTPWEDSAPGYPHELRICYQEAITLTGLRIVPRQDVDNGRIAAYAVYVAKDGRNWGEPITTGQLKDVREAQTIPFPSPVTTRWLRFVALSGHNDEAFAAVAELEPLRSESP